MSGGQRREAEFWDAKTCDEVTEKKESQCKAEASYACYVKRIRAAWAYSKSFQSTGADLL